MLVDHDRLEAELADRIGPILSDGTALRELIDLDKRAISPRVLHDPEIHRLEVRQLHARSWQIVAHESEIPDAGDFVRRSVGADPVIVTRDREGEVQVLLNSCAHRGMEVCWADQGNQSSFKCPYHGWVYDSRGNLLGAPFEKEMYGNGWDKSELGLRRGRVATRHGVIFTCFDDDTAEFEEWLGDVAYYLDEKFGDTPIEVIGPGSRLVVKGNWKMASEQFSGDFYHQATLHRALGELGFISADPSDAKGWGIENVKVGTPQGHSLNCTEVALAMHGESIDGGNPFDGYFMAFNLFPSSIMYTLPFPKADLSGLLVTGALGGITPLGHDRFEWWRIPFAPVDAPDEQRAFLKTAGTINDAIVFPDDAESWPSIQRATQGPLGQQQTIKYNAFLGPSKPDDWPGPGTVYAGFSKDDNQWQFWLTWFEMMTEKAP